MEVKQFTIVQFIEKEKHAYLSLSDDDNDLIMSLMLGHKTPLWITHKANPPRGPSTG
jgi:hypothetical protein